MEIAETRTYRRWFRNLRDRQARGLIRARVRQLAEGHAGDATGVGGGVREMRIHCGPVYRVYYCQRGQSVVVLLAGGDKGSQARDIKTAIRLAGELQVRGR